MIQQVSVFVENKKGTLQNITGVLKENNIHIRALSIADTTDFGILRMIVSNPQKAYEALKEAGRTVSLTDVLAVGFPDEPGGLGSVAKILTDAGIEIEYIYAFVFNKENKAYAVFKTSQIQEAQEVLMANQGTLLADRDIYNM